MKTSSRATGKSSLKQPRATWFDGLSTRKQDIACIVALYLLILLLFGKIIFGDMAFSDSADTASSEAMNKAIAYINETEHVDALWIPYLFSGMPLFATLIFPHETNIVDKAVLLVGKVLFFGATNSWFVVHYFLLGLFMYLLARGLKFLPLPSLLAAVTVMLSTFAVSAAQSGHGSQLMTLSFIPLLFLLTHNMFQKRNILSFGLLAAALGTMFLNRHPQIAFYGLLLIGFYLVYEVVRDIRTDLRSAMVKTALFVLVIGLGFAIYMYEFLPTQEYSRYSIRGGGGGSITSGLDYDYATNWSLHPFEMLTFVVPTAMGFSSSYVTDWQGQERAVPLYWGWMPFTDAPHYFGILAVVLGVIALLYRRDRLTWYLFGFAVFSLLIAFGRFFGVLYDLFFNYVPFFNKFRIPSMILALMPMLFGILGAQGATAVMEIVRGEGKIEAEKFLKKILAFAGVLLLTVLVGYVAKGPVRSMLSDFMFAKAGELRQYGMQSLNLLREARFDVFWSFYTANVVYIALFAALIYGAVRRKVSLSTMLAGFAVIAVVDLYVLDAKLINPTPITQVTQQFEPDATVRRLQQESDSSLFRVLPIWALSTPDNTLMYHRLQMVMGYSPAKLKIYQELVDSCFLKGNRKAFDMLNVKYYLNQQQRPDGTTETIAQLNPGMLPRAWFADSIVVATGKTEVFGILNSAGWSPATTAVLEKQPSGAPQKAGSKSVAVTKYASREITLSATTDASALLVLSEVYYPAGWKAYVDGAETEIYKTNYVLRSIVVPKGSHTIEFKFEPATYVAGYEITLGAWGVTFLLILVGLWREPAVRQKFFGKPQPAAPPGAGSAG